MIFQHARAALRGHVLNYWHAGFVITRQISSRLVKGFGGYGLQVPKIGCFSAFHYRRPYNSVTHYRDRL